MTARPTPPTYPRTATALRAVAAMLHGAGVALATVARLAGIAAAVLAETVTALADAAAAGGLPTPPPPPGEVMPA